MELAVELSPREVEPSLAELSESFICPITQMMMQDPVVAADSHSYERAAIEQWIEQRGARAISPMTGARLAHLELTPNTTLRVVIQAYRSSLPQRHLKELSQKDLALAIKLREEELSNQLAKQHKQLEQLSSVQERLGPMAEENKRLKAENELLRRNTKADSGSNNNNNSNVNDNSNNDNTRSISSDSDPLIEKHLSDIHSLSQQLLTLNKAHAANMIKRLFTSRITRKKLKQNRLIQEEENALHELEILQQNYQKIQTELQQRLHVSLQEADSRLKSSLAEIGQKIAQHSGEDGNDDVLEKLTNERRRSRESHANIKAQLEVVHKTEQNREEQKQAFALQEQKNRLQQIRASKASKQRELSRWTDYTKNYTNVIEIQRQQLVEISANRSSQIEQLSCYSKQAETKASELMIARRQQEERKAAALFASVTPNSRVNAKAQSVMGQMQKKEITELFSFTIRGQLEEVRACLKRNGDLAHAQDNLTDLSERIFPQITGFQYAVWSGDEELWNIYLEFLTGAEAYDQLIALLKERPDITEKHGAPLSFFDPLLTAYQRYIDNFSAWNNEQRSMCWCEEVGGAQRNMPAWFVYVFSEEGEDKAWPTKQMTKGFTRKVDHLETWFDTCVVSAGIGRQGFLGHGFACARGVRSAAQLGERVGCGSLDFRPDPNNSATLKTECTKKLAVLTERLSQAAKSNDNTNNDNARFISMDSKQAETKASKLMIAHRQQEERKAAAPLASVTPNSRVNAKAQGVMGRMQKKEITELFSFTIRGQLEEVQACLKRNEDLAHAQDDLTDLSERTFPQITGFQYAVWSGDEELWNIYLEFLTETEAYDQLMALLKERPDIMEKHGAPLSFFDPLLTAYQHYNDNYNQSKWRQSEICWAKEVGGAQRNMPAWFIYMFSEEGKDKAWPTKQMTKSFSRSSEHVKKWFESEYHGGKLGSTFAFMWAFQHGLRGYPTGGRERGTIENSATLKTRCTQKLAALTERLCQAAKSTESLSSFGFRK